MNPLFGKEFHEGITSTFHFTNTIRSASLALTTEVRKIVNAGADDRVLEALYSVPGGSGQNLRVFAQMPDTEQESAIAETWLFSAMSRYEVWADSLPVHAADRGTQFPSQGSSVQATGVGYKEVFGNLEQSSLMSQAFGPSIAADRRILPSDRVDDSLAIFRYFKECRNAIAHSGGVADSRVEYWGSIAMSRSADLFVDSNFSAVSLPAFLNGDTIILSLRHVRAFVAIAMRLAYTVDADLLTSKIGFETLVTRWHSHHGEKPLLVSLAALRRGEWIRSRFTAASIAVPDDPSSATDLLRGEDLVRITR